MRFFNLDKPAGKVRLNNPLPIILSDSKFDKSSGKVRLVKREFELIKSLCKLDNPSSKTRLVRLVQSSVNVCKLGKSSGKVRLVKCPARSIVSSFKFGKSGKTRLVNELYCK